jgi:hypothetical protein
MCSWKASNCRGATDAAIKLAPCTRKESGAGGYLVMDAPESPMGAGAGEPHTPPQQSDATLPSATRPATAQWSGQGATFSTPPSGSRHAVTPFNHTCYAAAKVAVRWREPIPGAQNPSKDTEPIPCARAHASFALSEYRAARAALFPVCRTLIGVGRESLPLRAAGALPGSPGTPAPRDTPASTLQTGGFPGRP